MKFVLVGPVYPYRGGISHYTTLLVKELRDRNNTVLLISFKRQYPKLLYPGKNDKDPSKEIYEPTDAKFWIDSINPITWFSTFYEIHQYKPEAIILQWWSPFWAIIWITLCKLNRIFLRSPIIFICHNVLPHESRRFNRWLAKIVLQQGNYHIVQSDDEKDIFDKVVPGNNAFVIHHPIYAMYANQLIDKVKARLLLELPKKSKVLLFFGIIRPYKGLMDLLSILPEIRKIHEETILVIAGEFWDNKKRYLKKIKELGIEDCVIIHDYYIPNEQVGLFFSAADLLVAPYRKITGSGVIEIAKSFNLPIISTSQKLLKTKGNRLLSHKDANSDLAQAILNYFNRPNAYYFKSHLNNSSWTSLAQCLESFPSKKISQYPRK
jgi:glycosyltransferase involved in cell wall biosynthesis